MRIRNHIRSNIVGYVALFFAISGSAVALDGSNTVFSDDIVNGEVKAGDIAAGAVRGVQVLDGTVATDDLANGGVTTQKLGGSSVTGLKLAPDSVNTGKILDGNVFTNDIADSAVANPKITDGAVTSAKVLDGNQTGGGLNSEDINPLNGDVDILDNTITTFDLAANSVDGDEVVDFGLSNQDIGVLTAQINADGTVFNSSGGVTSSRTSTGVYDVDFGRDISNCTFVATQGEGGVGGAAGAMMGVTDRAGNAEAAFVTARNDANALVDRAFQLVVVC